jgi:hypothetical protein
MYKAWNFISTTPMSFISVGLRHRDKFTFFYPVPVLDTDVWEWLQECFGAVSDPYLTNCRTGKIGAFPGAYHVKLKAELDG